MDEANRTGTIACTLFLLALFCAGCVGPTTPLGAVDGSESGEGPALRSEGSGQGPPGNQAPRILFAPSHQRVHEPYTWQVLVVDPLAGGELEAKWVRVFYNGLEVTDSARFQFRVEQCKVAEDSQEALRLEMPHLRLSPLDDHEIVVEYSRPDGTLCSARYPFPAVRGLAGHDSVVTTDPFRVPAEILDTVYAASRHYGLYPVLLVALIAQESAFNPHAVSRMKALGLTQVTHLAEADIAPNFSRWPRYPGIQKLSRRALRQMIPRKIHGGNEWRLDPEKSVWGGAYYLAYLRGRLQADANRGTLEKVGGVGKGLITEAALASYNSGLNRILYYMGCYQGTWLDQSATREAKRYVRKVLSYYGAFRETAEFDPVLQRKAL